MTTAMTQQSPFSTMDLALATYLSMHGRSFRLTPAERPDKVLFTFESVSSEEQSSLEQLVEMFQAGSARVEPMRFLREVGSVRGQLYDFLDGKRRR
jgi:hypothetical protein